MIYMLLLAVFGLVLLIALFQVFIPGPSEYDRQAWPARRQGGGCPPPIDPQPKDDP